MVHNALQKKAQKVLKDYQVLILNWLRFNQWNSQLLQQLLATHEECLPGAPFLHRLNLLNKAVGRYDLCNIYNIDETPLPFEWLSGRPYDFIGTKTIWVKELKSGCDKCQASLVLCIFTAGVNRVLPMIIFHGTGT